jgi:hypothetical protein
LETEETGADGCGFICEDYLVELCGGNVSARRVVAIQVRIISPKVGVFKGMLCRKRITSGPRIHLPPSMKKIGPSRKEHDRLNESFIVICKNGLHPNSTNEMVGRLLDPNGRKITKTFEKDLKKKKLSDMITRIWKGLGVPEDVIADYVKRSLRPTHLNHAFLVGLGDPTNELPPGSIFVTGLQHSNLDMEKLFVTRSPCVEPRDGRMLPLVTSKPDYMSLANWEWLQTLPFGSIMFGNPMPGERPLPELIASGDLDGDLYFICWNKTILSHIRAEKITDSERMLPMDDSDKPKEQPYDPNWLENTQEVMIDAASLRDLGRLIGKLYTSAQKKADASDAFMYNQDSIEYARLYKKALELGKHGGKLEVKERLVKEMYPRESPSFVICIPE